MPPRQPQSKPTPAGKGLHHKGAQSSATQRALLPEIPGLAMPSMQTMNNQVNRAPTMRPASNSLRAEQLFNYTPSKLIIAPSEDTTWKNELSNQAHEALNLQAVSTSVRAANQLNNQEEQLVTINVITEEGKKIPFQIAKRFLLHYAPIFTPIFNGNPFTGHPANLTSDYKNTTPQAFSLFIHWIYNQSISRTDDPIFEVMNDYVELWLLADRLKIPRLQNQTMSALDTWISKHKILNCTMFWRIYENTVQDSPLRRYVVRRCAVDLTAINTPSNYPHQMLVEIFAIMRELHPTPELKPLLKDGTLEFFVTESWYREGDW